MDNLLYPQEVYKMVFVNLCVMATRDSVMVSFIPSLATLGCNSKWYSKKEYQIMTILKCDFCKMEHIDPAKHATLVVLTGYANEKHFCDDKCFWKFAKQLLQVKTD